MHTSTLLKAEHFEYTLRNTNCDAPVRSDFAACFADYHPQDRVAVVSVPCEHGALYTGYALLACTTAFYDAQRARGGEFFDYPQHYLFFDRSDEGVKTTAGRRPLADDAMGLMGHLDVWPNNKWVSIPGTVRHIVQTVFDYNIHRLFWPHDLKPADEQVKLPWYARKMMRTRLKGVYYTNSPSPNIEIHGSEPARKLVLETIANLKQITDPPPKRCGPCARADDVEGYEQVPVDAFLESIGSVFEPPPPGK